MIGGNTTALLQVRVITKDKIGAPVEAWHNVISITGWLDLVSGDSKRTPYHAKAQESTHIFISDYVAIPSAIEVDGKSYKVKTESARLVVNDANYDVMLIDDPMEMHKQLEIYVKYTGGQ